MKRVRVIAITILWTVAVPLRAQQSSIHPADLDRSADACTDFFQFANGNWRANEAAGRCDLVETVAEQRNYGK